MISKVIIIGSGPAGLTAAIYTGRANLQPIVIDGSLPGGQLMTTTTVENWPGEVSILGPDLMIKMREQATKYGATFVSGMVASVDFSGSTHSITLDNGKTFQAHAVIIANGSSHKKLGCPGEKEYFGRGVTVCATCDAPFYRNRRVVVVGGGNSAVTEAEHLTHFASQVTMLQIMPTLTATDPMRQKIETHQNVSIICNASVTQMIGDGNKITAIEYKDTISNTLHTIECDGIFTAIGLKPNTDMYKNQLELGEWGHIKLNGLTQTSARGVFAAGDICDSRYQQAISSSGDGCKAALDAQRYLNTLNI